MVNLGYNYLMARILVQLIDATQQPDRVLHSAVNYSSTQ